MSVQMGQVIWVNGPVVRARGSQQVGMLEVVEVGDEHLVGEVIGLERDVITIQVYEETSGLHPGAPVYGTGMPLSVELGPGLLQSIFDGIQRPLPVLEMRSGTFIGRGIKTTPLYRKQKWAFTPRVKAGDVVQGDTILGVVPETPLIEHRVMVPPDVSGRLTWVAPQGEYTIEETIARVTPLNPPHEGGGTTPTPPHEGGGTTLTPPHERGGSPPTSPLEGGQRGVDGERELTMFHRWPVRRPRDYRRRLPPTELLVTGQRVLDAFFPLAKGGAAAIPGGFGAGKCVTGDTPVLLGDGRLQPIADLFAEYQDRGEKVTQGVESYTHLDDPLTLLSFENGSLMCQNTSLVYKGKADQVIRITTRSGRQVKVTPVHKLFVVTPELEIKEVEARSLKVGDYLATPRRIHLDGQVQMLSPLGLFDEARVCDPAVLQSIPHLLDELAAAHGGTLMSLVDVLATKYHLLMEYRAVRNRPPLSFVRRLAAATGRNLTVEWLKGERRGATTHIPSEVSPEFAEFVGLLLADGHLNPHTSMFYNMDESLLARFEELGRQLFGLEPQRYTANTVPAVRFGSTILVKLMAHLGVPGSGQRKSRTCSVPAVIFKSPEEVIARFLGAYFSCDGSTSRGGRELEIATASQSMAIGLSYLLLRLGILHKLSSKTVGGRDYFRIFIRGKEEIGHFYAACKPEGDSPHMRKWDQISAYLSNSKGGYTAVDVVPADPQMLKAAYQAMGSPRSELETRGVYISNYLYGGEKMSTATFQRFAACSDSPQIHAFAHALESIFCDPIVDIEAIPGPHDVYDVTVPGAHNFVGGMGPLILHNTITQHQIAKWSDADVVIFVGCGERGNEMTEVLQEFPHLTDPRSGHPLMERTILIANTSNMPVAAREASIYTGITLAEYYRDMGYHVALMADSTSRWAEALREISGRLEEMPAEEGYPAYLAARLAEFYERAGRVITLNGAYGSVSVIGAVSPPGGDFSEPVTQHTTRFIRCFWALDKALASARHFPAINWLDSYSEYVDEVRDWWREQGITSPLGSGGTEGGLDWHALREQALGILQRESHLQQIVKLVGPDALPDDQRLTLETARLLREGFLQQNALDEVDSYATVEKQMRMLQIILHFHERAEGIIAKGCPIVVIHNLPIVNTLVRMKTTVRNEQVEQIDEIWKALDEQMDQVKKDYM